MASYNSLQICSRKIGRNQQLLISISNHSEPQVLSVIAQQILQIQNAIKAESVENMLVECRVGNWEGPGSIDDSFCLFGDVLFGDLWWVLYWR